MTKTMEINVLLNMQFPTECIESLYVEMAKIGSKYLRSEKLILCSMVYNNQTGFLEKANSLEMIEYAKEKEEYSIINLN